MYHSLVFYRPFPEEQKECHKRTSGTSDLLCIDQHIFENKVRRVRVSFYVKFLCTLSVSVSVILFDGISTFVGYLMPKSFSYKNSSGTIQPIAARMRGFIPFPFVRK